jgi:hypothetical protein
LFTSPALHRLMQARNFIDAKSMSKAQYTDNQRH